MYKTELLKIKSCKYECHFHLFPINNIVNFERNKRNKLTVYVSGFELFFNCCSSTIVSIFSPPVPPTPATPTSHPQSYLPLALSMCPLYMFLDDPSPFSPVILSHFPSGYRRVVLYINISGYILLACLFCLLVTTYR